MSLKDDYTEMIKSCKGLSDYDKLDRVNKWFNINIEYGDDIFIWGAKEYWASLDETLEKGCGDCDDIAIAKYFALKELGIEAKLAYVLNSDGAHMIAISYPNILDNMYDFIRNLWEYRFIYLFDENEIKTGNKTAPARQHLSQWDALLTRIA